MRVIFHSKPDNKRYVGEKQFRLLLCIILTVYLLLSFFSSKAAVIKEKKTLSISGTITSLKVNSPGSKKALVRLLSGDSLVVYLPDIPWEESPCAVSSKIQAIVKVYPYKRASSNVIGQAWVKKHQCSTNKGVEYAVEDLVLPEAGDSLGILLSATVGNKELLSSQCADVFRVLGISHLLVISGFHIGVVFSCIYFCFFHLLKFSNLILYRFPVSKIATLTSLVCCSIYVAQINSGIPAIRALLMLGVGSLAFIFDRKVISLSNIFFVAFVIVLASPRVLLAPGFLLSFSAVFGLILISNCMPKTTTLKGKLLLSLLMSFSAWSFSAPVAIYFFKSISLMAPLVNILAMPLFSLFVIIIGGVLFLIFSIAPSFIESVFTQYLHFLDTFLEYLWGLGELLSFQYLSIKNKLIWPIILSFVIINIVLFIILKYAQNRQLSACEGS